MLYEADEISEIFRGVIPVYLLFLLPLLLIISPSPACASHELPVYRFHQFELHGLSKGCKNAPLNLEARSVSSWRTQRHCIISHLSNLTASQIYQIKINAGGLLVILPKSMASLSAAEKEVLIDLETRVMAEGAEIPIYFSTWSPEMENIVRDLDRSKSADVKSSSAFEELIGTFNANGYQVVVSASKPSIRPDAQITSIQGKLPGFGVEEKLPTIVIVAHYDSFGAAPDLSYGVDSNGSGMIALLELLRIFSDLYSDPKSHAPVNLVFLLSGGGKFNFLGSKKWLEDHLDGVDSVLLQETQFVICLDTVGTKDMYIHVSKPPKEGHPLHQFHKGLSSVRKAEVDLVHKRINLADEILAWEHERYSIRRLPATTVSSLKSHKDPRKGTIADVAETLDVKALVKNIGDIASALARVIYNISGPSESLSSWISTDEDVIKMWVDFLNSHPRSSVLIYEKNNPLVRSLFDYMNKYASDVKLSSLVADKRDPEYVVYDSNKFTAQIYSVKPAIFELVLTAAIIVYLLVVSQFIQKLPVLYDLLVPSTKKTKIQ